MLPFANVMRLNVTFGRAVLLPEMLSIPFVVPVPSRTIVLFPSIVTGGLVEPMNIVEVIAMLWGPEPQLNVTVPPAEICACKAACVQELGVPLPTTPANPTVDRSEATINASTRTAERVRTEKQRKLRLLIG